MNNRLLVARKERRVTQEKLASRARVNHLIINLVEKHGFIPPPDVRARIAKALQMAEADLFGRITVEWPAD